MFYATHGVIFLSISQQWETCDVEKGKKLVGWLAGWIKHSFKYINYEQ